jgi:hypothetical protein
VEIQLSEMQPGRFAAALMFAEGHASAAPCLLKDLGITGAPIQRVIQRCTDVEFVSLE